MTNNTDSAIDYVDTIDRKDDDARESRINESLTRLNDDSLEFTPDDYVVLDDELRFNDADMFARADHRAEDTMKSMVRAKVANEEIAGDDSCITYLLDDDAVEIHCYSGDIYARYKMWVPSKNSEQFNAETAKLQDTRVEDSFDVLDYEDTADMIDDMVRKTGLTAK